MTIAETVEMPSSIVDDLVDRFTQSWEDAGTPLLEAFYPDVLRGPAATLDDPSRAQLLENLVAVDMEYRWKRLAADNTLRIERWLLADYATHLGTLWPWRQIPLTLIVQEYRVRHRWGDRPADETYVDRYPDYATVLRHEFARVLSELPNSPRTCASPAIPGYEVLRKLGDGGMGVVYEARHTQLQRIVALKVILPNLQGDERQRARFKSEAEAAARLQHPNIAQIYEVGEWQPPGSNDPAPYISMEHVAGGSLDKRLNGTPQPPRQAAQLVEVLARAVCFAHEQGIVHRDLKPANILLAGGPATPIGECLPKITDFGLAKRLEYDLGQLQSAGQTQTGQILGTPSYMAPEQATGNANEVGPRSDVYALGAILYEMLTGRPPFKGETILDTLDQVRSQEPVPLRRLQPKLPRDVETICLKCLEKLPEKRYADAEALADDLQRFMDGRPILARPASPLERTLKWVRRNRLAAAFIIALCAGLIGTTTAAWFAFNQRNRAEYAESESHKRLIQSYLDAANLAVERGAWDGALENYTKAEAAGHTPTAAFRLQKIRAQLAVRQLQAAHQKLETLVNDPGSDDIPGLTHLYRAELQLGHDNAEAKRLIENALASNSLPEAERYYAMGLIAPSSPEALRLAKLALEFDPFHQAANEMAAMLLFTLGRLDEAKNHLVSARRHFPQNPHFLYLSAVVASLRGEREEARQMILNLEGRTSPQDLLVLKELVENYDPNGAHALMTTSAPGGIGSFLVKFRPVIGFLFPQTRALSDSKIVEIPGRASPRMPLCFYDFGNRFGRLMLRTVFFARFDDASIKELGEIVEIHPEGALCFVYGSRLLQMAAGHQDQSDKYLSGLQAARKALLKAYAASTLIPVKQLLLETLAVTEGALSIPGSSTFDPQVRAQAIVHIQERLLMAPPCGKEALLNFSACAYHAGDLQLARRLIAESKQLDPESKDLARLEARVENAAGAHAPALRAARRAVEYFPEDERVQRVLQESKEKLQAEVKELIPDGG